MLERKFCCGGGNAVLKKFLGFVKEEGRDWGKGLYKCTHCGETTVRQEEVIGNLSKVKIISETEAESLLNPQ